MSIILVRTMAALFCLLITSTIILLTVAVVHCYCKEPTIANADVLLPTTTAMPSNADTSPSLTETTAVPLLGKY